MKSWEIALIVGGVVIVGALLIMKAQTPKATALNSSFAAPGGPNGLAAAAGGFVAGLINNVRQQPYYPNAGTYQTGIIPVQVGNKLVDPNTGNTLVYGTD